VPEVAGQLDSNPGAWERMRTMQSTLANLWQRRHLLRMLVSSNLKRQNKNTVLGYLWWLLDPMLMTAVYYVLVAVLFKRHDKDSPYVFFLMVGLLSWKAFSDSLAQSVLVFKGQAPLVRSIGFPKVVLPLSIVLSNGIYFMIALLVAFGLGLAYGPSWGTWPSLYYLLLPIPIIIQLVMAAGFSLIVCTLGVFFHDTANILNHILRMWFFLTPVLYPLTRVPTKLLPVFRLNPFSEILPIYRDIIIHGRMPLLSDILYSAAAALVVGVFGYLFFRRYEGRLVQRL